ncbi:hypothetical protein IEQ34_001502 [Dendrobium chrysotoxum]|uniref:Uncharacterized protein n=1 Tax=Dendrobium chrysotoxum TaxID=161865 RepID=A0AAV7HNU4_DENCH|nr:hypothetical protein IEQ34_001502 [Dendrobium chrysotoxum]
MMSSKRRGSPVSELLGSSVNLLRKIQHCLHPPYSRSQFLQPSILHILRSPPSSSKLFGRATMVSARHSHTVADSL